MKLHFPDTDTIGTALTLATRAPSIHHSQPGRWQVGDGRLRLYLDRGLQLGHTDPDGRDLIVSCGAALNHCVVALAALGWRSVVHHLPDPADTDLLAAIEVFPAAGRRPDDVDVALAAAIARRRTDRRCYSSRPVSAADIALMGARAARLGVMLRRFDTLQSLKAMVMRAVRIQASDVAAPLGRVFAGAVLAQHTSPSEDHGVMLALGTAADDRLARLRAGEATSVVLLTATSRGMAGCPVTEPLESDETRAAVRADVFGTSGYPQMLLRVGWAPTDASPLPTTPRRQLNDVVYWPASVT